MKPPKNAKSAKILKAGPQLLPCFANFVFSRRRTCLSRPNSWASTLRLACGSAQGEDGKDGRSPANRRAAAISSTAGSQWHWSTPRHVGVGATPGRTERGRYPPPCYEREPTVRVPY